MTSVVDPSRRWGGQLPYAVVPELRGPPQHHHVRRTLAYATGVVFVFLAYVALLPTMTLLVLLGIIAVSHGLPSVDETEWGPAAEYLDVGLFLAGTVGLAFVLWRLGILLIRGHRHFALFLRKFGFTQATEALSLAIGTGLGRQWRLVTLDDHDVAPVGVSGRSRWAVRLVRLLLVAGAIAATVGVVRGAAEREAEDPIGYAFTVLFSSLFISLLATGGLLLTAVSRSARRAEHEKAVVVTREAQVRRAARKLSRASRRVLAPRVMVARVSERLWQHLVHALALRSDVVLVDVSFPTDNLLWEIRSLAALRVRWLPIGRVDRLALLYEDPSPTAAQLRWLLGGREVIGYRLDLIELFSDGLRHSLDVLAARP